MGAVKATLINRNSPTLPKVCAIEKGLAQGFEQDLFFTAGRAIAEE